MRPQQTEGSPVARPPSSALEKLAESRWFRAVADYTYDWESWHGADGRLIWVNPAVERITGRSAAECLAMRDYPLPIVVPEDRPRIAEVMSEAIRRASGDSVEFRIQRSSEELRWMSISWQPMYDEGGEYLGFRTSVRDVTERRNLRDQLRIHADHLEQLVQERTAKLRQLEQRQRQMEKLAALGQLAAGVAHEINNPLAGIRNSFELIKSGLLPQHEQAQLLGLVDREIERISNIVHQMFQLYRRDPQEASHFALTQTISEVVCLLENFANKCGVELQWDATQQPNRVHLPEGEVKQILFNLIRNAIQVSPPGAPVVIEVESRGEEFLVHVEDHGPGIPHDVLPRIFDPFFSTRQEEPQNGMGLGLSISRNLIEAMGGHIDVETTLGRGSRFTAVLPSEIHSPQELSDG